MTCAKRTVVCILLDKHGRMVATGTNKCDNPQPSCPRLPGEGYEKCESVCMQDGHAEIQAIRSAKKRGFGLTGGTAIVAGHDHVCEHCRKWLERVGITDVQVIG